MSDLVERLNSLIAERAGGGPSEATYDPELLAIGFAVADRLEQLERVLAQAREALAWSVEQGGGPICEHESGGSVCFCKENQAIAAIDEALNHQASG